MLAADYPFLDILWTMFIFFLFIIWIWILITVFADIFRRKDIGGGSGRRSWIIFVILLPYPRRPRLPDREPRRDGRPEHPADAETAASDGRLHPVRRRLGRRGRRDREGQGPPRLGRDHAGRVRLDQAEGAGIEPRRVSHWGLARGQPSASACVRLARCPTSRSRNRRRRQIRGRTSSSGSRAWIVGTLVVLVAPPARGDRRLGLVRAAVGRRHRHLARLRHPRLPLPGRADGAHALGWYGILRYAYPGGVTYMPVLAATRRAWRSTTSSPRTWARS